MQVLTKLTLGNEWTSADWHSSELHNDWRDQSQVFEYKLSVS